MRWKKSGGEKRVEENGENSKVENLKKREGKKQFIQSFQALERKREKTKSADKGRSCDAEKFANIS